MTPATPYFLTTDRLAFRRWSEADFELARGLWGDPAVTKMIVAGDGLTDDEVRARLALEIENERRHGVQYWPVFRREDDSHVGCCGLRPRDPARGVLEIGVHVREQHWGHGIAAEASRAVVRHAFVTLGARGIFAGHHPQNDTSRHLLLGMGFEYTGDEDYAPTGLAHPSYELTAERYAAVRDQ